MKKRDFWNKVSFDLDEFSIGSSPKTNFRHNSEFALKMKAKPKFRSISKYKHRKFSEWNPFRSIFFQHEESLKIKIKKDYKL